ncbi:hypothetical protein D9758_016956 [Tetrapyrgos nigripes]|uniref:Glycoside hydrolase family 71 protein n=1 Tax=Tetrapyrgos nigripes TaxID=182062 RepID=A0A8H5BZD8_9AGAR|nr:hypothetical protein D9758_016956 [Tetrapyrgos nigripes]
MRPQLLSLLFSLSAVCVGTRASVILSRASDASGSGKLVFCHFMIGIVSDRSSSYAYDADMTRAKAAGIDAFALNIGTDGYTDQQLQYAYDSAARNNMKVFLSFDFNWYSLYGSIPQIAGLINKYSSYPSQLRVDNKIFVSSFVGDGVDVNAIRRSVSSPLYFAPNFHPGQADFSQLDGAFSWQAWQTNGQNRAPSNGQLVTIDSEDKSYVNALQGKGYIAPASPWFSTHYGREVSYSKNWVFPGDLLWYNRWFEILALKPRFVEMITWNDYGESHYIGPLSSPHYDDGNSKWVNDMPHNGWLDMAKPFIAAYKAGASSPNSYIKSDQIIYWYRTTPKNLNCDSTDTVPGIPDGFNTMSDNIFIVTLLMSPGTITVQTGAMVYKFKAPSGASAFSVPFQVGAQTFTLTRNGKKVQGMSATSLKEIKNQCTCGIYNFNAYVGTVPEGTRDDLQPDGLAGFSNGLRTGCQPTPSLPPSPPPTVAATATSSVGSVTPSRV